MKNDFFRKTASALCLAATLVLTCACGNMPDDAALSTYKANMEQFFENVNTIDQAINNLDTEAEGAPEKLLEYLDALDLTVSQMAALEVPEGFDGVSEYAKDASDCMSQAVSYFHDAYEGEFNASYADAAFQYYTRANKDLKKIVKILHGEGSNDDNDAEDDSPLSPPVVVIQDEEPSGSAGDPASSEEGAAGPEGNWDDDYTEAEDY